MLAVLSGICRRSYEGYRGSRASTFFVGFRAKDLSSGFPGKRDGQDPESFMICSFSNGRKWNPHGFAQP